MNIKIRTLSILILLFTLILAIPKIIELFGRKPNWILIRAMVTTTKSDPGSVPAVFYWNIDNLSMGDQVRSPSGKVVGRLIKMTEYEDGSKKIALLDLSLLASYNPLTRNYRFMSHDLLVGSNIDLVVANNQVSLQITDLSPNKIVRKTIHIEGVMNWQKLWFSDTIHVGDSFLNSSDHSVIARVTSKRVSYPEERPVISGYENLNRKLYRDIKISLDILVEEKSGVYYFSSFQPVKVGNTIYIPMNKYNLYNFLVTRVDDSTF